MPKIIKDLDKKIYKSAFNLFREKGYNEVDMKTIAKDIGIAVGTLYNYYPNKEQLFIEVLKNSWADTMHRVEEALDDSIKGAKDRLKIAVKIIYEDIEERKGLGREVMRAQTNDNKCEYVRELRDIIDRRIESAVMKYDVVELEQGMKDRFMKSLVLITTLMIGEYKDEKEKNMEFIHMIIDSLFS